MKKTTCLLLVILLLLTLLPQLPLAAAADSAVYRLPVFETTDIHGHLVDTSTADAATYTYRMAAIGKAIDDARIDGDRATTLVLDGGDIYQGNVVSNLNNGEPMVAAFDAIGYDAVALGNHEFDWGVTTLCDSDGTMTGYDSDGTWIDCEIPVLASNIYYADTGERVNFTQDYVILEKTAIADNNATRTVHIAVIGFAENYRSSIMPSKIAPYTITQTTASINAVKTLAATLKSSGQADAVILLSHWDATDAEGYFEGSEIDLILGGHSHRTQYSSSTEIPYLQGGAKAGAYGEATLTFSGDTVSVTDLQTHTLPACTSSNTENLNAAVYQISLDAIDNISGELSTVLGYVTRSVSGQTAGNFVCDMYNRGTGALVSVTNSGGIRTTFKLPTGASTRDITVGDIYTMMPFDNHLFVYQVTYADLYEAIRRDTLNYIYGVDWYPNALVVNGQCVYYNGTWLGDWATRAVLVSVNEYVATINTIYTGWTDDGKLIDDVSYIDNLCMIDALQQVSQANDGLIPTDTENHRHTDDFTGTLECAHSACTYLAATPATCTAAGAVACWQCSNCGAFFAESTAQTHLADITVPLLGHSYTTSCLCDRCGTSLAPETETAYLPAASISDGDTVVLLDAANHALSATQSGSYTQLSAPTATVTAGILTEAASDTVFTVEAADGVYQFTNGGKYLTGTASGNLSMADTASDYSKWLLEQNADGWSLRNYKAGTTAVPLYLEYYNTRYTLYKTPTAEYFYVGRSLHSWDNGTVTTPATCTQAGEMTYTCTVCEGTKTEEISALGSHSYGEAAPMNKYTHSYECALCGDLATEAHTFENHICTVCGAREHGPQSDLFEAVMTAPTDWSGDYVIVSSYADAAMCNSMTNTGELDSTAVTLTQDKTVTTADAGIVWTIESAGNDTYRIYNAAGYLKINGTSSTDAVLTETCEDTFTIAASSTAGVYKIISVTNANRCFAYYASRGTFRTYSKSSYNTGYLLKRSGSVDLPTLTSAALRLSEDISVIYTAEIPADYENPYMTFAFLGKTYTVSDYTVGANGTYCFEFAGVTPPCMGENISATLHASYGAEEYTDTVAAYSVRTYCQNQLANNPEDTALVTLLSDLLTYGAAAQTYIGYHTDALVTEGLSLTPSGFTAISDRKVSYTGTGSEAANWNAATLTLGNAPAMRFYFTAASVDTLTVTATLNGRVQQFTAENFVSLGEGRYYIEFRNIKATEFDDTVTAAFTCDGAPIGRTVHYSVNAYLCSAQNVQNENLQALVRALYCYGASAAAYPAD